MDVAACCIRIIQPQQKIPKVDFQDQNLILVLRCLRKFEGAFVKRTGCIEFPNLKFTLSRIAKPQSLIFQCPQFGGLPFSLFVAIKGSWEISSLEIDVTYVSNCFFEHQICADRTCERRSIAKSLQCIFVVILPQGDHAEVRERLRLKKSFISKTSFRKCGLENPLGII